MLTTESAKSAGMAHSPNGQTGPQAPIELTRLLSRNLPTAQEIRGNVATIPSHELLRLRFAPANMAGVKLAMAMAFLSQGKVANAVSAARKAYAESIGGGHPEVQREAFRVIAFGNMILGNFAAVPETISMLKTLALAGVDEADTSATEVEAWYLLRTATYDSGKYERALELFEEVGKAYAERGNFVRETFVQDGIASCYSGIGRYLKAIEVADFALKRCEETGTWKHAHRLLLARAAAVSDLGYYALAEPQFLTVRDWAAALEDDYVLARALWYHGQMPRYSFEGRGVRQTNHRRDLLQNGIDLAIRIGCLPIQFMARMALYGLFKHYSRFEEAAEQQAAIRRVGEQWHAMGSGNVPDEWLREGQSIAQRCEERTGTLTRSIVDCSPDAMFVFDPIRGADGRPLDFYSQIRNSAANELIHGKPRELFSLGVLSGLPLMHDLGAHLMKAIAERATLEDEVQCQVEGKRKWYARRIVPIEDMCAVCLTDTTRYHEAEERALEADRAKSAFLATMSHEIRTPISGVLGLANMLSSEQLNARQRVWVDGIISGADILLGVIGEILDLSKIEAGRLELEPTPVDPAALVRNLHSLYRGQAVAKNISLDCCIGKELPNCVSIDPIRLGQILANLVNNAIKFTERGGVCLSVERNNASLRFQVSDTGQGISPDAIDRIFDPFEQANRQGSPANGTGLGLAIAKKLVDLMGGALTAESELGVGTTFSFSIPVIEVAPEVLANSKRTESDRFRDLRIMLAEDNTVNAMVGKFQIEKLGCEVKVVPNGKVAVQEAASAHWDLIFMDLDMPEMDGFEATRQIREQESLTSHVPILALTANAFAEERERCLQAGMDDFLTKPLPANAIRAALEKWVQVGRIAA
jgi:signal transduction histidine kinase/CheY-like chemotaxis protein